MFVPFSLPHSLSLPLPHTVTPTHSHINTELSLAYRDSLLLWSKAFIWWLGLKNGHLLLPLINSACVCECVCYWICCLLGFFGKNIYRKCILCCRMSVFKCVLKRQIVKARKMKNSKGHVWLLKQWLSLEQMMDKILWHPSMNGLQTKIIISIFPGISFLNQRKVKHSAYNVWIKEKKPIVFSFRKNKGVKKSSQTLKLA